MTARGRSVARITASGLLLAIAFVILPFELFVIGFVVVALVSSWAVAMHWYETAIATEAERIHLVFEVEGLRIDKRHLAEDYDSTVRRLGEVLDEHALCPAPVEPKPITRKRTAKKTTGLKIVGGTQRVPAQRNGGE